MNREAILRHIGEIKGELKAMRYSMRFHLAYQRALVEALEAKGLVTDHEIRGASERHRRELSLIVATMGQPDA